MLIVIFRDTGTKFKALCFLALGLPNERIFESGAFDLALLSNGFTIDIEKVCENRGAITLFQLKHESSVLLNSTITITIFKNVKKSDF